MYFGMQFQNNIHAREFNWNLNEFKPLLMQSNNRPMKRRAGNQRQIEKSKDCISVIWFYKVLHVHVPGYQKYVGFFGTHL